MDLVVWVNYKYRVYNFHAGENSTRENYLKQGRLIAPQSFRGFGT